MITTLSNLTAAPSAPKSGIAPQESVGTGNFALALGGFEAGLAQSMEPPVEKGVGLGALADDLADGADASALDLALMLPVADGKALPGGLQQVGIGLPPELPIEDVGTLEPAGPKPAGPGSVEARIDTDPVRGEGLRAGRSDIAVDGLVKTTLAPPAEAIAESPELAREAKASQLPPGLSLKADAGRPVAADTDLPNGDRMAAMLAKNTETAKAGVTDPTAKGALPASLASASDPESPTDDPVDTKARTGRTPDIEGKVEPAKVDAKVPVDPQARASAELSSQTNTAEAKSDKEGTAGPSDATNSNRTQAAGLVPVAARSEGTKAELPLRASPKSDAKATDLKIDKQPVEQSQRAAILPDQPQTEMLGKSEEEPGLERALRTPSPHQQTAPLAALNAKLASADTTASQPTSAQAQVAVPVTPQQMSAPVSVPDANSTARLSAQLESTIDQLTETRSNATANKPEMTVRHQEFGAITMRLETLGGDLRATLSARDPGFVPAIHNALADRAVAASSETSSSSGQRGSDQGSSQSNSQNHNSTSSQGQGWQSDPRYGSSTGSGQGTSQPYAGQNENRDDNSTSNPGERSTSGGKQTSDGERFA